MSYKKSEMLYSDYSWEAGEDFDDPRFKKYQDSSMLNRSEGYEILWFINYYGHKNDWKNPVSTLNGQKIERAIRTRLPEGVRTNEEISNWIAANWNTL